MSAATSYPPVLPSEIDRLREALKQSVWLIPELDVAMAYLDELPRSKSAMGGKKLVNEQSVLSFDALLVKKLLISEIEFWSNEIRAYRYNTPLPERLSTPALLSNFLLKTEAVEWLATRPALFRHAYNSLLPAVDEALKIVDHPDDAIAEVHEFNEAKRMLAEIPEAVLDGECSAPLIARVLKPYLPRLYETQIYRWAKQGKITGQLESILDSRGAQAVDIHGGERVVWLFRVRDVVEIWIAAEGKRSERLADKKQKQHDFEVAA